jgi:hypothetical protein
VTTSSFESDPVVDFVLGRAGASLNLPSAVGLTFVGCLLLAATDASGFIGGDVAVGAFVILVAVLSWWAAPGPPWLGRSWGSCSPTASLSTLEAR